MNFLLWGAIYLFIACCVWAFGYLFAAREFGNEVKFYKNCVHTLRVQMQSDVVNVDKTREEFQVAEEGLKLWVEAKIDAKAVELTYHHSGTMEEAFLRGEKFGFQAVLLHLKGYL